MKLTKTWEVKMIQSGWGWYQKLFFACICTCIIYVNYFILICELLLNHKVKNQFKMLFICYFTLAYELISISIYKSWFSNYGKASISQKGECLCCNMENSKFKKAFFFITDLDLLGYLSLHSG